MSKKRFYLKYNPNRALLSDVLPFETPIIFNNRQLYRLVEKLKIKIDDVGFVTHADFATDCEKEIVSLLFPSKKGDDRICRETVPFTFQISHKKNETRSLSVPHPVNQLSIVNLYKNYDDLILSSCEDSPFSIRRPSRKSKTAIMKDTFAFSDDSKIDPSIEESDFYSSLVKSYFVYSKYSNVYKFFESYDFHKAEKKFEHLVRFDIAKCFDSIYTHSLSWALVGKEFAKKNRRKQSLGNHFDNLMQKMNHGETNGILIGPEFSRIFSELILQSVDKFVSKELRSEDVISGKDYQCFRYVDDYFLFYNDRVLAEKIILTFRNILREYKMHLSDNKIVWYSRPIITELTIAKKRIVELFDGALFKIEKNEKSNPPVENFRFTARASDLITAYKTILKELNIENKDILNFTLAVFEKRFTAAMKKYAESYGDTQKLAKFLDEVNEFIFYIYFGSPRVNSAIKISKILTEEIKLIKDLKIPPDITEGIFKNIYDNIFHLFRRPLTNKNAQVEHLYFLIILEKLGRSFLIDESVLADFFNLSPSSDGLEFSANYKLNYFTIVTLLFYIKGRQRYAKLRKFIEFQIKLKINSKDTPRERAECVMLFFDSLTCPFISNESKTALFGEMDIPFSVRDDIMAYTDTWFTVWNNFDFNKELVLKVNSDVY